ncbi:MAG: hypothetical protein N3D11_10465, partial [Candidatus Sumerlaeia bacterium]|nr:hypothetical protein [Candidatus Sumerlaeia bacterium]
MLLASAADRGWVCACFSAEAASSATTSICFIFTGSRQSELEPCGCTESQNGGVDREALLYQHLRAKYPRVVAMDAGGWTDPVLNENERMKSLYLVRALARMGFDAFNVTPYDWALGTTVPAELVREGAGRLLSANVRLRAAQSGHPTANSPAPIAPYVILPVARGDGRPPIRVAVLGVTHTASLDTVALERSQTLFKQMPAWEVLDVSETLRRYVPELRKQADFVILLAMMNRAALEQLLPESDGIDLIVTTYNVQSMSDLRVVGNKTLANTGFWGRYFVEAVVEFDASNRPVRISGGLRDIPADPALVKLLEQYREDTKNLQRRLAVALEQSRFAGRNQCIVCHQVPYLQWTRTPHNFAFVTLSQKNQHYNPDCLPCHVTGYHEPDGFVDLGQTPHLASVQCEECHGPGKAHAKVLTELL